jgi:two-component system sensor histidine kinase DegS
LKPGPVSHSTVSLCHSSHCSRSHDQFAAPFEEETQRQIENLREAQLRKQEQREQQRAELLRRTVRAQESERQRIARELHDEMGQTLTALGLGLRAISNGMSSNPAKVKEQTTNMLKLVDACFDGLQNLISGLHPPQLDDFGLMATLRWYTRQVHERYGLSVELLAQGEEITLPADVRIVLYRIVQEGLTNIIRHAQTLHAKVHLVFNEDEICIRIEDNGCGFDVDAALQKRSHPCWGLLGMIERARLVGGDCRILSNIGAGTLVEVCVPIQKVSKKDDNTSAVGG